LPMRSIKYKEWSGGKTRYLTRLSAMIIRVIYSSFTSKGIVAIFVTGIVLVHAFPGVVLVMTPHPRLSAWMLIRESLFGWTYLTSGIFAIFTFLLVSGVTSNLISEDLRNRSFVVYFSRPIGITEYLIAKFSGAFSVMSFFCLLPPVVISLMIMATQTSPYYGEGLRVLLMTVVAGIFASMFFIPYGIMLSSLTKRRLYAGIGTFMTLSSLTIVGEFFSTFSPPWKLVNPMNVLHYSFEVIYGYGLPLDIDSRLYVITLFLYTVPPVIITIVRVNNEGEGV